MRYTRIHINNSTFYYGELNQAGQTIDLVAAPVPFEPMIDRDTYFMVQELSRTRRRTSKKSRKPFLPIRYMVYCDVCKLVFSEIDRAIKEKLLSLPDSAYDNYLKEIKAYSDTAKTKLRSDLSRAKVTKAGYKKKIAELSPSLSLIKDERALQTITEQIGERIANRTTARAAH